MLVGNPFGGKTSLLRLLAETLNILNEFDQREGKVEFETINPKSMSIGQLFGFFNDISYEWSNGVVPNIFRYICNIFYGHYVI